MLALLEAVVGRKEDVRVIELAAGGQLGYELVHELVDGQHRLKAMLVELVELADLVLAERILLPHPLRLVRDVLFIERRHARSLDLGELALMPRRDRGRKMRRDRG